MHLNENKTKKVSQNKLLRLYYAEQYENRPIDEELILYETRDGKSIVDSPLSIFLYLCSQEKYNHYKHIWVIDKQENEEIKRIIPTNLIDRVSFVYRQTIDYVDAMLSAKYLISNSTFESFFLKRPGQIYVNTWHGTPLKKMGFDTNFSISHSKNVLRNFLMTDYLLSPNEHTSNIFIDGYRLRGAYKGEILEGGYPRIDQTFNSDKNQVFDVLESFGTKINREKPVILFTPTWKGSNVNKAADDIEQIIVETMVLVEKFRTTHNVLIKVHPFIFNSIKDDERIKEVLVSDYVDPNSVLAVVDLLITDYSSIFFDYLVTNKPVIFYVWDNDLYDNERGMYFSQADLPGPIAENIEDLVNAIEDIDHLTKEHHQKYLKMKELIVPYDDGEVTKRYVEYIFSNATPAKIKAIKVDSQKKKLLIYPGGMRDNGITTSFLNLIDNIDYEKYDVTILSNEPNNPEVSRNLEAMNKNVRPMFRFGISIMTEEEEEQDRIFKKHGIAPEERSSYLETAYNRETRRLTADIDFDVAIDFSGYSYFWGRHILGANAKNYVAFMHNDLYSDAHREVDGQLPMFENLMGLFSLYYRFDKLLSVSPMTRDVNAANLSDYVTKEQMKYVINTINIDKILKQESASDLTKTPEDTLSTYKSKQVFVNEGPLKFYKNISGIKENLSFETEVKKDDQVIEFAKITIDNQMFSKISVNYQYLGWVVKDDLAPAPIEVFEIKKFTGIGTVASYLEYPIWKELRIGVEYPEIRTKAKYLKGQYLYIKKIAYTDRGRYYNVFYKNKELGWVSVRVLKRIHKLSSLSPYRIYFNSRMKKIDSEKNIGIPDKYEETLLFSKLSQDLADDSVWTRPPGVTGAKVKQPLTDFSEELFETTELIYKDANVYAQLKLSGKHIGYTSIENLINISQEEYEAQINQLKQGESNLPGYDLTGQRVLEFDNTQFNFVTMGRLSPEKNQLQLIEGFHQFVQKYENCRLYILGKGPLADQLIAKVRQLKLQGKVFLLGHISDPFSFVEKSDVFVLPSLYEGQPMVLLETLTLGMRILASNIPANIQVVGAEEKFGLLTDGTTATDICHGLERIYQFDGKFEPFDYKKYNQDAINNFYDEISFKK